MSTAREDGARRMLEMMTGHADGELFPRADDRVRLIEAAHPDVVFDRHEGGAIIGWGLDPILATGRIDGEPFAFTVEGESARLWVWPEEVCGEKLEAPCREMPPNMMSEVAIIRAGGSGADLCDDCFFAVFTDLLEDLHETPPYDGDDDPRVSCEDLYELIREEFPEPELLDLGFGLERSPQMFLRMPSKATMKVSWGPATSDGNLAVHLYAPYSLPLSRSDHVLEGHAALDQQAFEAAVLDDSWDATMMIVEAMFDALRRLDPVTPYFRSTIKMEESEREQRQRSAVAIQKELAAIFTLTPISLSMEKGWIALCTIDESQSWRSGRV